ncbi:30S ribosomal protein S12 methylthiotransferase RimO [bacterium]|nr:30S ribosomal protein S12 methylthiotransferase RimO [bacterium]
MSSKLHIIGDGPKDAGAVVQAESPAHEGKTLVGRDYQGKVAVVNLGCAKNQVDAEVMLGALHHAGFELIDDPVEADIAVVNTCGFLQSAVEEGVDTILDLSELKSQRLRKLIVAGCMVERYGEELRESLPEVDHFLGGNDLLKVIDAAREGFDSPLRQAARPYFIYDETVPRVLSEGNSSAFVKISEGCNRPCSFCIIPRIRGTFRSRAADSIIHEVRELRAQGVREVNLVAQDLTAYGEDRKESGEDFRTLLRRLDQETEMDWIRPYYAYPLGIHKELLQTIVESERVVNYLDIPLQHVSESILRAMKRPMGKFSPKPLVEMMRTVAPEIALRTTFIVGHPGEDDSHIEELADFLRSAQFEHVGIFTYSQEEGTPSYELAGQVPEEEKEARRNYLMEVQQELQSEQLEQRVGETYSVLLDGHHPESDLLLRGRTPFQGPDVDGEVIINDIDESITVPQEQIRSTFGEVLITETAGYDLIGTLLNITEHA